MNAIHTLSSQPWVARLGSTLIHFLWQGALIAILYGIARRWIGHSLSAQVRYILSCAALAAMAAAPIVTFLIIGASESAPVNPFTGTVPASSTTAVVPHVSLAPLPVIAVRAWSDDVMPWLVMAWFAGAILFWARLTGGCFVAARMRLTFTRPAPVEWQRKLDNLRIRICISRPVKLLTSALVQVPTVVGWLVPVVLFPVGALSGLPPEHVEALLAHELAHIRRHDYLVNILQSIAEALLFYHPAVWWISNHIRNERELCCDDVAVAISGDAFIYARALSNLESSRPAHFNPALAANGGSLPERVGRLLGIHPVARPASGPAVVVVIGLALLTALVALAQSVTPKPAFEVASIKPSPPEYVGFQSYVKGDRYTAMTATVRDLVSFAYRLRSFQISGGPAWAASTPYNITAKMDSDAKPEQAMLMMQSLLADRFGLQFHRLTKDLSGYALVIDKSDKSAPRLTESTNPGPGLGHGRGSLFGRGSDMGTLAKGLSENLDSPVTDRTGLTALYDFTLTWTPDEQASELGPSIFTAVREQLGLRLEPVKNVPVDILIIDQVEKPSED